MLYVMICMFNEMRSEMIVRFVNIGGIVDHHCLNFLFIAIFLSIVTACSTIFFQRAISLWLDI